jgi:hypothetical protein
MSVTRFLGGRRPKAIRAPWRAQSPPVATVELGTVQPIVVSIDDNGRRFVGLALERDNVSAEGRVADPHELHATLAKAIAWQEGDDDA